MDRLTHTHMMMNKERSHKSIEFPPCSFTHGLRHHRVVSPHGEGVALQENPESLVTQQKGILRFCNFVQKFDSVKG